MGKELELASKPTRAIAIEQLNSVALEAEKLAKADVERREAYLKQVDVERDAVLVEYLNMVLKPIFGEGSGAATDNRRINYWASRSSFGAYFTYDGFKFRIGISYGSFRYPYGQYNRLEIRTKRMFRKEVWMLVKTAVDVKALLNKGVI